MQVQAAAVLKRVKLSGTNGLSLTGQVKGEDLTIDGSAVGVVSTGSATINRAIIRGVQNAISASQGTLNITNALVSATGGTAVELVGTAGSIASTTVYSNWYSAGSPAGVRCASASVAIRSSIVWTPTTTQRVGVEGGCPLSSSIVGPVGVAGAPSSDPLFINIATRDFRLSGGSPARDAADSGPTTDIDKRPRPQGLRFDLGAYETP